VSCDLPDVAADLHVSLGAASAIIVVPGLVAAISSPLVVTLVRGLDRRVLVLALSLVLIGSDLLTWLTPGFALLLVARVLVGLALGGVWAVGRSLGMRLATPNLLARRRFVVLWGFLWGGPVVRPVLDLLGDTGCTGGRIGRAGHRFQFSIAIGSALGGRCSRSAT
jgi:predicted MFS family arabinose efflux permease